MSTVVNGKPIRNRGGNKDRPSRKPFEIDARPSALRKGLPIEPAGYGMSDTQRAYETGKYSDQGFDSIEVYTTVKERDPKTGRMVETPIVELDFHDRDDSLTRKQLLRIKPQQVEFSDLKQRDKATGKLVKAGSRISWRSDKTLLRRGNPFKLSDQLKRQTSRSKVVRLDPDTQFANAPKLDTERESLIDLKIRPTVTSNDYID